MDESSKSHWLRIAQLAGLTGPFTESEMAKLSESADAKKRFTYDKEKRKKLKVDELGNNNNNKRFYYRLWQKNYSGITNLKYYKIYINL